MLKVEPYSGKYPLPMIVHKRNKADDIIFVARDIIGPYEWTISFNNTTLMYEATITLHDNNLFIGGRASERATVHWIVDTIRSYDMSLPEPLVFQSAPSGILQILGVR